MALNIKIDFGSTYDFDEITPDYHLSSFDTELANNQLLSLKVKISNKEHALIPNVYNLAFGPLNKQGKLDDKAEVTHKDYSKLFSTILFAAYAYLKQNPDNYVGVDGSDNARAYIYYRAMQNNFKYLNQHLVMYGVKYYVRISRFGKTQYANPFNFLDVRAFPVRITDGHRISQDEMYNYFIFALQKDR